MSLKLNSKFQISQFRELSYGAVKSWYSGLVKKPPPLPPYKHIVQIGDPVLRSKANLIPTGVICNQETQFLVKRLKDVAKKYNCVGLSAPQIGVPVQMLLMEFDKRHAQDFTIAEFSNREMNFLPQTIIINPELKVVDYTKITHTEACGSVKGFFADVPRFQEVQVRGLSQYGDDVFLQLKGWLARILQHEMDHLNGTLFTDVMNRRSLTCSCWNVVNERRGKVELPFSN